MKLRYVVALLVVVLMMGCATETPLAEPAPAEEAPVEEAAPAEEAPVEEAAPAEEAPVEAETELSDADQEHIDRLKPACERGTISSCLVLKNKYGINWPPAVAEEPEASDEETTE